MADGTFHLDVRAALADVIPDGTPEFHVDAAVAQASSTILAAIVHEWPVASGVSLSGFTTNGERIDNEVDYTSFVLDGLVDKLAAKGIAAARVEVAATLADIAARAAAPAGTRPTARGKVAQALASKGESTATSLLSQGRTMEAVAAYRAGVQAQRIGTLVSSLGLTPGLASAVTSLATAARGSEAVGLLQKVGRTMEAARLASLLRSL